MRTHLLRSLLPAFLLLGLATTVGAQDSTRGVRIGLSYDPGAKPGIVVLPVSGAGGDSIRAIVQRDLDFGDRISVIALDAAALRDAGASALPNWALMARLGAAAAVQVTPTASGFHLAIYNVATRQTALVKDYAAPAMSDARGWRASLHRVSDDLEESITGTRGIASTRVLFVRNQRIWIVDGDGQQTQLVVDGGIKLSPSWHPNGRMIAYTDVIPAQVVVRDLAAGRDRVLASGNGTYISPIFTPDGTGVLFAHGVDEGVDLYLAPAVGGSARQVSIGRGSDNVSPSFSPDGRRVSFMSARAGHPEIYTMDADGTNVDLLTPLEFGENAFRSSPDWSPDGRVIAFQSRTAGTFQLLTISLRDRSLKQLTSDGSNEDPSWAPDGRHLVFISDRSGSKQLWVLDTETGRSRQLTRGASVRNPAWSPRLSS